MKRNLPPKLFLLLLAFFAVSLVSGQETTSTDTTKAKAVEGGQTPVAKTLDTLQMIGKVDTTKAAPKPQNTLIISVDMRTRGEVRHGYRTLPLQDTAIAGFVNQRTRLNFDFKTKKFDFFADLQDTRIWGQQDPREGLGTTFPLYLFEIYAEPHFNDKWSVRIGRQRIEYDNQRIFAENDWRLQGQSHDAVRLIYNNKINLATEFSAAFNQSGENNFTTNYTPVVKNYKTLLVHYLNWKMNKNFTLTTINTADGYQSSDPKDASTTYMRFTNGGRLEYSSYNWYLTFSGYYQHGRDSSGRKLSAFYIQPEIKYAISKTVSARLGFEYLSGQDTSSKKDNNFVPLYGVAHRFMGNLDLFTTFPADVNNGGIFNPYLFFQYKNKKTTIRFENHLFYSHTAAPFKGKAIDNKYLGFENDWRFNYKANAFTDIEFGFCWAAVTNSMVEVKYPKAGSGDLDKYSKTPYFTYLSLRFTPSLLKFSWNN